MSDHVCIYMCEYVCIYMCVFMYVSRECVRYVNRSFVVCNLLAVSFDRLRGCVDRVLILYMGVLPGGLIGCIDRVH